MLGSPSTYGVTDLSDATRLATRLVANYGLSDLGITTYAPVPRRMGFMQRSFEVTVDNIRYSVGGFDHAFGTTTRGGMFQPSDANYDRIRKTINAVLNEAYDEDMVRVCCGVSSPMC